jgi:replicative DNA helicase
MQAVEVSTMTDYIPPHALEAEVAVLAGCMARAHIALDATDRLKADDFYRDAHRLVFEAVRDLVGKGQTADIVAVTQLLRERGQIEQVGGATGLYDLSVSFEGVSLHQQHVSTVADKAARRRAITAMREAALSLRGESSYHETVDSLVGNLTSHQSGQNVADPQDVALDFYQRLEGDPVPAFRSGWKELDRRMILPRGMLTIITGLPGSGKSTFLDALLHRYCETDGNAVYFSPEQGPPGRHLVGLVHTRLGKDPVGSTDHAAIEAARAWWQERVSWIEDHRDNTTSAVLAIARARAEKGANILVIDPYNNMVPDGRFDRQDLYIQDLLRRVKRFARETNMAVVIVAHPKSVPLVSGTDSVYRIPTAGDISGGQEWWNHADLIVSVWRNQSGERPDMHGTPDRVRVVVQKVRDAGRIGNLGETVFYFRAEERRYYPEVKV